MQSRTTSGPLQFVSLGSASSPGGRAGQDDRAQAFSFMVTWQGKTSRCTVAAVLDGHHGSIVSELASSMLPTALTGAVRHHVAKTDSLDDGIEQGMKDCILQLDTATFNMWHSQTSLTGGTTLLVLLIILETGVVFTCNVGDCKAVLSVKGNAEALSECHNPPVPSEKLRFEEAGISCFNDHIGGSDINVCRTIGDYDLGSLKWREVGDGYSVAHGPLTCTPDINRRQLDDADEFIIIASDGMWDYYTPESSIITDVRRHLRRFSMDGSEDCLSSRDSACSSCATWLVESSLARQRDVLHEGTPGDNVTVVFFQLRLLPSIPRARGSRLGFGSQGSSQGQV